MKYGYVRVAALSPTVIQGDPVKNSATAVNAVLEACGGGARLVVLPRLFISGAELGDLFLQETLLRSCEAAVAMTASATADTGAVICIGTPANVNGSVLDCTAVINRGRVVGLVPCETPDGVFSLPFSAPVKVKWAGADVTVGSRLLFADRNMKNFVLGVRTGSCDVTGVSSLCTAGAVLVAVCDAQPETVTSADHRRDIVSIAAQENACACIYAGAGCGESVTDHVFSGHCIIAENGRLLAESAPFGDGNAISEPDLDFLCFERRRRKIPTGGCDGFAVEEIEVAPFDTELTRKVRRMPFVPECSHELAERCERVLEIQSLALCSRLKHIRTEKAVVGLSGGLDSCLAALVAARAVKLAGGRDEDLITVTMPCFGTTGRTRSNAEKLAAALGASFSTIDISATVRSHFNDISLPDDDRSVVFENAQARARTYVLMDLANRVGGLVVGTGDLSELALGWATYNGDHMSMYGVNAGVPKTLIRAVVRYCADTAEAEGRHELSHVLGDILSTPVSPELLPAENGEISQKTEDIIGPYELHDFIMFCVLRCGFPPAKIFMLMCRAFGEEYSRDVLKKWLVSFYRRFFAQQFKRSCLPDGPAVGSVTLSPRGGWTMPSDACAGAWLSEAESLVI